MWAVSVVPLATVLWRDPYESVVSTLEQQQWIAHVLHQPLSEIEHWPRSMRLATLEWCLRRWVEDTLIRSGALYQKEKNLDQLIDEALPWDAIRSWRRLKSDDDDGAL